MGKIARSINKINFTMLHGSYCYIFIENFPQKFSPCTRKLLGMFEFWVYLKFGFVRIFWIVLFLRSERRKRNLLGNFWVSSNSGFIRNLGLFVFFKFGLLFLRSERSEQSLLGNFWVCSKFAHIFCLFITFISTNK